MFETSIDSAAGVHLALYHPNIVSTELSGSMKFAKEPRDLQYVLPDVQITQPAVSASTCTLTTLPSSR